MQSSIFSIEVAARLGSSQFSWRIVPTFHELTSSPASAEVIAIDVPIGLLDVGARPCDVAARRLLGPGRASSVFPAPIRAVLAASTHAEASAARRAAENKGISIQSWAIVPKIREVDEGLRGEPALQSKVREVHPEVCFYFMVGQRPMQFSKKKRAGREERRALLRDVFGDEVDRIISSIRGSGCAADDVLDALVALWTARRMITGEAVSIPANADLDPFGLPMAMLA